MNRPKVLVVDDDDSFRAYLGDFLLAHNYEVEKACSGDSAIRRMHAPNPPSLLILDLIMPSGGGLDVLEEMARARRSVPTIVLSAMGQVGTVVKAMRLGATDYLVKPFEESDLVRAIQNALDGHGYGNGAVPAVDPNVRMYSRNEKMIGVQCIATQVADTDVPVIILGESGVGKEVLARHIHNASERRGEPFVKVNCAALPADLLESELFGYERGAFTGAMQEKPGKFEAAGAGTILLDEIGEMAPALQAKLLHVLQDGEYQRLGSSKPRKSQARVLAATNRRLDTLVKNGTFREDLYFRLNVIRLEIPPLRERREDIGPLVDQFLEAYRAKYNRPVRPLPPELARALERYSWPGNIRQLENVIKRYVILPDVDMVLDDLTDQEASPPAAPARSGSDATDTTSLKKASAMAAERVERELVRQTLDDVSWNRKKAARQLGISYKALLNKLKKWDLGGGRGKTSGPPE